MFTMKDPATISAVVMDNSISQYNGSCIQKELLEFSGLSNSRAFAKTQVASCLSS